MTPEEIRYLFDYNDWANQRSLEGAAQLSDKQFAQLSAPAFPSVRDTLVHICSGEWVWLERCQDARRLLFPMFRTFIPFLRFAITGLLKRNSCEHLFRIRTDRS